MVRKRFRLGIDMVKGKIKLWLILGGIVVGFGISLLLNSSPSPAPLSQLYREDLLTLLAIAKSVEVASMPIQEFSNSKWFTDTVNILVYFYGFSLADAFILGNYAMERCIGLPGISNMDLVRAFPQDLELINSLDFSEKLQGLMQQDFRGLELSSEDFSSEVTKTELLNSAQG